MDRENLQKLVEKEEAATKLVFHKAKEEVVAERRSARMHKSERASKRRADRTREANIARREKAKLEREKKSRASLRNRETLRRQRIEAQLLDELSKQKVRGINKKTSKHFFSLFAFTHSLHSSLLSSSLFLFLSRLN